jgi:hypothetical protein
MMAIPHTLPVISVQVCLDETVCCPSRVQPDIDLWGAVSVFFS